MTTNEKTTSRKLGADRNEATQNQRRARSRSESRDVHEDRGTRQSKFNHPERSVVPNLVEPAHAHPQLLLNEHASGPKFRPAHLRFFRDGAHSVSVAGSFNNWQPQRLKLHLIRSYGWEIDLCLPPGEYEYRFIVDGDWTDDPLAARVVENGYGGVNAVLTVQKG